MIVWSNGKFVKDSKTNTLNWVMHYGGSVWEGLRSYQTEVTKHATIFQLTDHISRLFDSAKFLRLEIPYTQDEIRQACRDLQLRHGDKELYFRPIVYPMETAEITGKAYPKIGIDIYAFPLPNAYPKAGIEVITSSYPRSYPAYNMQCKSSNNYGWLRPLKEEAKMSGAHDILLTDDNGHYTEASTANIFIVRRGKVWTPPNNGSILPGITRGLVMEWHPVQEKSITKMDLVTASEVFITGTYAEITPIISVDNYKIGDGKIGPITSMIQRTYFKAVRNRLWHGTSGQSSSS